MRVRTLLCSTVIAASLLGALRSAADASPAAVPALRSDAAVSLVLRFPLRNGTELDRLIAVQSDSKSPFYHHWLTPQQFRSSFGPTGAELGAAVRALSAHGFHVTRTSSQLVHFTGSVALVERQFATHLHYARSGVGRSRAITAASPYRLPADIAATGGRLLGLGEKAPPSSQLERATRRPDNRYSAHGLYWFDDLKQAYSYPSYAKANGTGVTIALVNFLDYSDADAQQYFASEKLGAGGLAPAPVTRHVFVGPRTMRSTRVTGLPTNPISTHSKPAAARRARRSSALRIPAIRISWTPTSTQSNPTASIS